MRTWNRDPRTQARRRGACVLGFLGGLLLAGEAAAGPYDKLADELSRLAKRTGYTRVAVLPFRPSIGGGRRGSGMALAERLVSQMAARPGLQVVERTLLDGVLREQRLGLEGVVRPGEAREVGRVLGVEAIITGTFLSVGSGKLEVHTRLIDAETARILGAATAKVKEEWKQDSFWGSSVMHVPVPDLGEAPVVGFGGDGFRDAPAPLTRCDNWEKAVSDLQSSMIETKARYWAARLREPSFSMRRLRRNPGSEIRSLSTRHKFYARMKQLYDGGYTRGVSVRDEERMRASDRVVRRIVESCY